MSTPIPPTVPKKNRYNVDLTFKHIKAITLFQLLFKQRRQHLSALNTKLSAVYHTLISVMNSLTHHYSNETMNQDDYTKHMLSVDEVLSNYEKLPSPLTHENLNDPDISITVSFLEYQTIELVKKCGASTCYDVLKILVGPNWSVGLRQNFVKLMKFYNTMFVPRSVRLIHSTDGQEVPLLPEVKKNMVYTESALIGLHGAELTIPFYGQLVIIRGYFQKDPLNIARVGGALGEKLARLQEKTSSGSGHYNVSNETFKNRYIHQISLRDFLCLDADQLAKMVYDSHTELKKLLDQPLSYVTEQFVKSKLENKSKLLTLLLLSGDQRYASSLIRSLGADDSKQLSDVYRHLHWNVQKIFTEVSKGVDSDTGGKPVANVEELPYEVRIDAMKAEASVKQKARDKLKEIRGSREGNEKATKYLDGLLRVPFGVYKHEKMLRFMSGFKDEVNTIIRQLGELTLASPENDLSSFYNEVKGSNAKTANDVDRFCQMIRNNDKLRSCEPVVGSDDDNRYIIKYAEQLVSLEGRWGDYKVARQNYLGNVRDRLECIYGQRDAKRKVESLIAQWINGEMEGAVFGFRGPPGTGKTSLAKEGLAQCLTDEDGTPRPFAFIALGGSTNGSILEGHNYTYVGSKWGRIVEVLMDTKCMNPIIYFDELDKISGTPHGRELIGILTHLTDPQQNDSFTDRYFDGIKIDLSKALIIFSYNDPKLIDSILLDRITEVNFKHLVKAEKIHIGLNFMLPKILASVGYTKSEIIFSEGCIEHIVESYVYEAGVRGLKEKLYEIIREINTRRLQNEAKNPLPITVTHELIDDILERKNRIIIRSIPKKPQIGWVNGLYATASGIGGLTVIQVFETISEQKFSLELTGALGDVMKESIKCAKTITWQIIPTEIKKALTEEWKTAPYGLHIHCPEAATPKDGPSAGAAITTAIVSYLCKMPVRNYIAMTGEIDLHGHVHAIGGLQSKIEGAIRAGAKLVLIPHENGEEWDELASDYQNKITVVKVNCIEQVLQLCLINRADAKFNVTVDPFEERHIVDAWELVCKLDQEKNDLPPETPMFTSLRTPMVPPASGITELPPLLELPPTEKK